MPGALINIDVPDLALAEAFYTRGLGLHAGRRFDGWMELLGLPVPVYLLPKDGPPIPDGTPRGYGRHWTPVHVDLAVEDLDAVLAAALEAGATVEAPPRDAPYGRIAMIADPFGHGWCLIQFNEGGYDCYL